MKKLWRYVGTGVVNNKKLPLQCCNGAVILLFLCYVCPVRVLGVFYEAKRNEEKIIIVYLKKG